MEGASPHPSFAHTTRISLNRWLFFWGVLTERFSQHINPLFLPLECGPDHCFPAIYGQAMPQFASNPPFFQHQGASTQISMHSCRHSYAL
ncbi:hypothetical protein Mmc1_2009 [Magnetococcus marinus MC-1]|uniref:Uncharacterized protein n=1 Tax=Magnetococcus marinus (strain ATCC BAA-1437 / JCM 17883 / MC-1) TaxID=156889 RepID=A0L967_MAGMM|nr:hypothetical protein Mmc1_2009 [Magnetococcus marinus MC-1]